MPVNYLSAEGLERLKFELQDLKTVKRREAASRIEAAKALGDLAENAEYHDAKETMALLEGRIMEIENILKNALVIEEQGAGTAGEVRVGSTVAVEVNGKQRQFMIVGSNEAEPAAGKISNESPIGMALLGSRVGDVVEVTTPGGVNAYEILEIKKLWLTKS